MLLVKNPWGHQEFRGKWCVNDTKNWTPSLKKELAYERVAQKDNGIFWMDFQTFCLAFQNLYINWNTELLKYRKAFFGLWKQKDMSSGNFVSIKTNP